MTHFVTWTIEPSYDPAAKFTCDAEVGADCRAWCSEGCDEFCPLPNPDDFRPHKWADTGECRIVTWLENAGTAGELYAGGVGPVRSAEIEAVWDGDNYLWRYAEVAPPAVGLIR